MSEQGPTVFNGRYEIQRRIGDGGMAAVFLARDQSLDRKVAVKVLHPRFAKDSSFVERFRREATLAANLNHPNIVAVYDWGEQRGTYFIVMEYVEGRTLADIIRSEGPLHPDRAAEVAIDVTSALDTAHRAGMVHRDATAANVMITPTGQVKVTDFGIATALAGAASADLTQAGQFMGTATYASPEQAQGKKVDQRSDIYSVGVMLYEMLAGRPPFTGDTPVAIAYKHVQEPPVPPSQLGVSLAPSLEAITLKALAKNPDNRYPSALDLQNDLRRYREGAHQLRGNRAAGAAAVGAAGAVAGAAAARPVSGGQPVAGTAAQTTVNPAAAAAGMPGDPYGGGPVEPAYYAPRDDGWRRTAVFAVVFIMLMILLVALVIAFGNTLGFGGDDDTDDVAVIELEDYIGENIDVAQAQLTALGLVPVPQFEENAEFEPGIIFDQSPPGGTRVEEGDEITLRVSEPDESFELQNWVGQPVDLAQATLEGQGLIVEIELVEDDADANTVLAMNPPAGSQVVVGDTVTLRVSEGPGTGEVPDVAGKTLVDATTDLVSAGYTVTEASEASTSVPEGRVVRTDPPAGSELARGEAVTVFVSTGTPQVQVPSLIGLFADTASAQISSAGLTPLVEFQDVPVGDPNDGKVIDQSPAAGAQVDPGSEVTIIVGRGVAPTTTVPPTTSSPTTAPPTTAAPTTAPPSTAAP